MRNWDDEKLRPAVAPALAFAGGLSLPLISVVAGILLAIVPIFGRTLAIAALSIIPLFEKFFRAIPAHPYLAWFCLVVLYMEIFLSTESKRESIAWINPLIAAAFGIKCGFLVLRYFAPSIL